VRIYILNCLKFADQNSYLKEVKALSDQKVDLERRNISNLAARIKFDYNMFRSNLYSKFIFKAKKLMGLHDAETIKREYEKLLKASFDYAKKVSDSIEGYSAFDDASKAFDFDETVSRSDSLLIIEEEYEKIHNENGSGYLDFLNVLPNYIINFCGISLYRLYGLKLLESEFLRAFDDAPRIVFGGPDENGNIDYAFSLNRYIHQISFDIDLVENNWRW